MDYFGDDFKLFKVSKLHSYNKAFISLTNKNTYFILWFNNSSNTAFRNVTKKTYVFSCSLSFWG